jgi:hypothetical protein
VEHWKLGNDRFEQDAGAFRDVAAALDRIADAGGTRTEIRNTTLRRASEQVAVLPSPEVDAPRLDNLARGFVEYRDQVRVPEVIHVYRALRALAVTARETAAVIDRCEVYERNWLDQLGHDVGRALDKGWHAAFDPERSEEVNREHDRLASLAQAASVERAGALETWRRAVAGAITVVGVATEALASHPADCPAGLIPDGIPPGMTVPTYVRASWLKRSGLPTYDRLKDDPDALAAWWESLSTSEKLKLREARPELAELFPDVPPDPGDPGYCTPAELAADRYVGRVDATTDILGLPRLPDCAQDIPDWFLRYRHQLTQVTLPAEGAVDFLSALSGGLLQISGDLGIPPDQLVACNQGDETACAKVGIALGMAVPAGGRRGGYQRSPTSLPGSSDLGGVVGQSGRGGSCQVLPVVGS